MITHTTSMLTERISCLSANHETDRPALAGIWGDRGTLVVDAGNSPSHARLMLDMLAQRQAANRIGGSSTENHACSHTFVVLTHWHWDHVFGAKAMNLPIIAQEYTNTMIRRMMTYDWTDEALDQRVEEGIEVTFCSDMIKKEFPHNRDDIQLIPPHIVFQDKLTLDLGGLTCHIHRVGGDHTEDSTIVYVEEDKTLFLGDCLAPDLYLPKWTFTVQGVLALVEKLAAYDADIIVESHTDPVDRATFARQLEDLRLTALAVKEWGAQEMKVREALAQSLGRNLSDDDMETIQYFMNGL